MTLSLAPTIAPTIPILALQFEPQFSGDYVTNDPDRGDLRYAVKFLTSDGAEFSTLPGCGGTDFAQNVPFKCTVDPAYVLP